MSLDLTGTSETSAPGARMRTRTPGGRFLSNGRYTVLLTRAGGGASWAGGCALTAWSGDRLADATGLAFWVRDLASGRAFTIGSAPAGGAPDRYHTAWRPGRCTIVREEAGLSARMDVCVLADADAELRRVTLANRSDRTLSLELTSCAEVVLNSPAAHAGHPAFSKLFVQTEFVPEANALLARRRPRANDEVHPWLVHALLDSGGTSCETDRARFTGRVLAGDLPRAIATGAPLSGTTGSVLDPVVALRRHVELAPGERAELTFVLGLAADREAALALATRWPGGRGTVGAFARAGARAREEMRGLSLGAAAAESLQALAAAVLDGHPDLRASAAVLAQNAPCPGLAARLGLSAGRPLVLAMVPGAVPRPRLEELARAARYWSRLGLEFDVLAAHEEPFDGRFPEGLRLLHAGGLGEAERVALASSARAVFGSSAAELGDEVRAAETTAAIPVSAAARPAAGDGSGALPDGEALREFNGFGGFSADGREYVVRLPYEPGKGHRRPPQPWTNVIANERFGFLVSESGAGHTWSVNSREHRLTPWSNDPLLDPHGEALWLRDEDSGAFWSPAPGPSPAPAAYEARHGFGCTTFRHESAGLGLETSTFADADASVRVTRVRITNRTDRPRRLSLYSFQRLVLGVLPGESARYVVTANDAGEGLLTARNPMAGELAARVAFAACVSASPAAAREATCDRDAFLGTGGVAAPAAVGSGEPLDGRAGAGLDPCFAERLTLVVEPGETAECAFAFGDAAGEPEARAIVRSLREPGAVAASLAGAKAFWDGLVSGVHIETPAPELDLMVNGWLAYQTLSCRIWGRTAFYQSGGAFGFRDQLQDAASLVVLRPELAREQIVLHAAHQFLEGDVLHWWHPPLSKGIRTRFADDLLWLPYLASHYVATTGDWSVLEERARWLHAEPLAKGEDEKFLVPADSGTAADVYEHCCRAIDRSLVTGAHGLPLFGSGDWNDGMNRVGREGRGESVWMGFFLYAILGDFAPLCERRGDSERRARYAAFRDRLRAALEDGGWDGEWYRRAYYDDGTPLGSAQGDECRIDGLAQAWAVISGAAPPARARMAMAAAERQLVDRDAGLVRLLTPAFRDTPHDPGYIKGYVAGVRENGGQYTHAALWFVRALAELGARDRAAKLLAMLSPVSHTRTAGQVARYRTEPYVIVADVYGEAPHVGRGGWTWYTGSAGWMLRVALESVLGLRLVGGRALVLRPCVPDDWPGFSLAWRVPGSAESYEFRVRNPHGSSAEVVSASLDGAPLPVTAGMLRVPLALDGRPHRIEVELGREAGGMRVDGRTAGRDPS